MPTTYSVSISHTISTASVFDKTVVAKFIATDLGFALQEAYRIARNYLTDLPEGEITLFAVVFPPLPEQYQIILDCSIDYNLLFRSFNPTSV